MPFLNGFAVADGSRVALIAPDEGASITYAELDARANAAAEALRNGRNLVFIEARNTIQSVVNYCAALRSGSVVHLLDSFETEKTQSLIDAYAPNVLMSDDATETFNSRPLDLHPDLAVLLSTSGSTGTPKFVKLSRENLKANARSIVDYLGITPADRALNNLKPHYSFGLSIINSHFEAGASIVLTDRSWMEDAFWQTLDETRATSISGVPYSYEMLERRQFDPADHASLRYAAQAGGKLHPRLVRHFAGLFSRCGKEFFVMYGQTEAAPRMSFLPPDMAADYPHSIGRAIPGGELMVLDDDGVPVENLGEEGILAYRGANVMMGYALEPDELASDDTPDILLTGDLAREIAPDLFEITGRVSRFVKPFGLRISLDQVEAFAKTMHAHAAVTGTDEKIVIALEGDLGPQAGREIVDASSERFSLPAETFEARMFDALPLLSNGKIDYAAIKRAGSTERVSVFRRIAFLIKDALGFSQDRPETIMEAFRSVMQTDHISADDTFESLGGDSLSYVSLTLELEQLLGQNLPRNWTSTSIDALEALREDARLVRMA